MRFPKLKQIIKRRKYWVAGVMLLGTIGVLSHAVSAPVKGHSIPIDVKPKRSKTIQAPQLPQAVVQSPYFTLDLPAGYRVQDSSSTVLGLLYEQTLVKPSLGGSLIVSITVKDILPGGLSEESSYQWRANQTNRFKIQSQNVSGDTVTVANDTQSASILAYWAHGAYLATISITAGVDNPAISNNADELTALQPLLKGWQWQL